MTRILVQRGSGSSSNQNRAGSSSAAQPEAQAIVNPHVAPNQKDEDIIDEATEQVVVGELLEYSGRVEGKTTKSDEISVENVLVEQNNHLSEKTSDEKLGSDEVGDLGESKKHLARLRVSEKSTDGSEGCSGHSPEAINGSPRPLPPPIPPPRPSATNISSRKHVSGGSNSALIGPSRRAVVWPSAGMRSSPSGSRPSSPRSPAECEGYNSADEQGTCFRASYDDSERERQFEHDIRRARGLEIRRMLADGNCLFQAVADQVYGDSEVYDLVRQMCIDYMERERDHFSQFITEGFTSYCKRKRRDKVYGNNVEIQALSEMYNRPIHIYSYSTEPINTFHGNYNTENPPIRLSYHYGNHYNSLVDTCRATVGAGLGFSSLRGRNVDKDQIKDAIKAQQDQQIDNALLAEGQFYSDVELTEKEIKRMVMEASRAEYLVNVKYKPQLGSRESSTSGAEPSSSGARPSGSDAKVLRMSEHGLEDTGLSSGIQIVLSMGFSYMQAIEAYSIFGGDVDSMVCYLLETSSRRKGKATEY